MKTKSQSCFARFSLQRLLTAGLLTVLSGAARADTIVSSLESFENSPANTVAFSSGSWAASSFQTGNQSWNLSSVTMLLGGFSSTTANFRLYSDAANQPGISLADLGSSTVSGGSGLSPVTFTLAGGLTLDPGTTYWIALGNTSPSQSLNVGMLFDDSFAFTGAPGTSMAFSAASGGGNGVNPPSVWTTGPNVALLFALEGTVVPEPSMLGLLGLGGLLFGNRFFRGADRPYASRRGN